MKFTGFKVIPSIRVRFFDEGEFHYEIADDQDPAALEIARLAEVEADCELPEAIELRWAPGSAHMAFRDVDSEEGDESPVSGDFCGFGAILQASYELDGQTHSFSLCEGDFVERIEQMCAGLNALLDGHRQQILTAAAGLRSKAAVMRNPTSAAYHDPAQILETAARELEAAC